MTLQKSLSMISGLRIDRLPSCSSYLTGRQVYSQHCFRLTDNGSVTGQRNQSNDSGLLYSTPEDKLSWRNNADPNRIGNEMKFSSGPFQKLFRGVLNRTRRMQINQSNFSRQYCQTVNPSAAEEERIQKALDNPRLPEYDYHYDEDMSFFHINGYNVYPWSISGLGTSVIVNRDDMTVAFDIGYASREAFCSQYVFISHGHTDHTMGLTSHASKREMNRMVPATYYVPDHLVKPLVTIGQQFSLMEGGESLRNIDIRSCRPGQTIKLPWDRYAVPFPTHHRVPSQGYLVYHEEKRLKHEYEELMSLERVNMMKQGIDLHNAHVVPEIAYTGDTTFDVFLNPPTPDLLKVKLLITECTFVDDDIDRRGRSSIKKAEAVGHIHLRQICEHPHLFDNVDSILLIHFSDRYPVQYIRDRVHDLIPESLKNKIYLGLTAQELYLGLGSQDD